MRVILDTHALIWWLCEDAGLSKRAHDILSDAGNDLFVSAVSAFEIATKYRIGKLPEVDLLISSFDARLEEARIGQIVVTWRHGLLAGQMAGEHKDPFDRLLAAQAMIERMPIVSIDTKLDLFGAERFW